MSNPLAPANPAGEGVRLAACDLCGLDLSAGQTKSAIGGREYRFCCNGCRQVFHMLAESEGAADPATFRDTEIFKKCQEMGIIPASEEELHSRAAVEDGTHFPSPAATGPTTSTGTTPLSTSDPSPASGAIFSSSGIDSLISTGGAGNIARTSEITGVAASNTSTPGISGTAITSNAGVTDTAGSIRTGNTGATPPDSAGSDPQMLEFTLQVEGMWCPACAFVIDHSVARMPGIGHIETRFITDSLRCRYNPVKTSPDRIAERIRSMGYPTRPPAEESAPSRRREFVRFALALLFTMNVMMLSFALYSGFFSELSPEGILRLSWPLLFMSTIVMACGTPLFRKAVTGIGKGAPGMESLIGAAAVCAYLYSTLELLSGGIHLYYDTASMLITLTLLGKGLENNARKKVAEQLRAFFSLMPKKARIVSSAWPEGRFAAAEHLGPGTLLRVLPDETIAADGRITEGVGSVDESSLTGEARPVLKRTGDPIKSGTRVIQGDFTVKAEKTGMDSTLGQMIRIMEKTLTGKTKLEEKTDRWLRYFVPAVIFLSLATGVGCVLSGLPPSAAMMRAITVMVISCPCALGIAIPLTRVAGISAAGKAGILVRDFSAFEKAEKVDTWVFDKTGTLTEGRFALRSITTLPPFSEKKMLALAAALEENADHHIAAELLRQAEKSFEKKPPVHHVIGHDNGIEAFFGSKKVRIGSETFLSEEIKALTGPSGAGNFGAADGLSRVYMSFDGKICAVFSFGDRFRTGAAQTIETLKEKGYRLAMISGDGNQTVQMAGKTLGIESARGSLLPAGKVRFIRERQVKGDVVAMVGDGINDAPALVRSDLSVAMHSFSQLGRETADITLMRGQPQQIIDFLDLASRVNRKIRQNLAATFLYNTLSIPLAMSGLLNPLVAVTAMLLSSLSVTLNTLLLSRGKNDHSLH